MSGSMEGLVLAVTGAASGIGRAVASVAAGLVLTDRDGDGLHALRGELSTMTQVEIVPGDIADETIPRQIVAQAVESFGRLDAAVNNAGVRGPDLGIHELTLDDFDRVLGINLRAVFCCMQAQLNQMYAQGHGAIVNVASASVLGTAGGLGPYVASKTGLIGLSKVASKEAGPRGVRVNVVAPGRTDTPLFRSSTLAPGALDAMRAPIALQRFGLPEELADAILYLCSSRASFTTGAVLVVDGGRTG